MKYTLRFLALMAAASIVFFSCEKENATDVEEKVPGTTGPAAQEETNPGENTQFDPGECLLNFGASLEKTRVDIDFSTGVLTLEDGDEALVYNGTVSAVYVYNLEAKEFSIKEDESPVSFSSEVQVFYPADEFRVSDGNVIFTMPAAVTDANDLGAKFPLAGHLTSSEDSWSVHFKAVCSILKVNVTGALAISGVKLQNAGSARMPLGQGAEFTIGWNEDLPTMTANESATKSEMLVSRNVTLNSDTPETFYYIVPAGVPYTDVTVHAQFSSGSIGGRNYFPISRGNWTAESNKVYTMSLYAGLFSGGEGTEDVPYRIANARDFKHISEYCTNGYGDGGPGTISAEDFLAAHYEQTAGINFKNADLSAYMIGSDSYKFSGSYDGGEYALSNFSITGTANYTGLWRYADGATFSDIRIQGAELTSTYEDTGIIAGRADNSSVSNCIATTTTVSGSAQRTGGLFGMVEGGSLTGCIFGAETDGDSDGSSVTGGGNTGGLVGICNSNMTNCSNIKATVNGGSGTANGGVAGSVRATITLSGCTNSGAVNASKDYNGGIVGYATGAACTLDGCLNSGNVTAGTGNKYIGGVVGMINIAGVSISNCTNSGSVSKGYDIGGIVGYVEADIDITSCENSGSVTAQNTSNNSCAGGIVGWSNTNNVTIVLCDNSGAVTASRANVGGIVGEIVGGKIDRCTNRANVKITDAAQNNAGGVGGYVHGTTYIKRCYSAKVTIQGGTRIGGIVGNLIDASQIVNCAVFSQIRGARTGSVGTYGIGTIAGCQSGTSLIANCLARDNGVHVQNTGSDTQLAGGIVGFRNGGTLQNCFTAGVLNNIRSKSKNGPNLAAYVGQVCGKSTAGTIKDCYYRGHSQGARALGTGTSGTTTTNVTLVSTNATTGYSYTTVPVEVTTSTGTTFEASTVYLKDLLNAGLTDGGISGYTPEEGEEMTWEDHILATGYEGYPFPSALATLGAKFYDN